ncbi:hypothetical protein PTR49_03640 [Serratia ureilytica]|uniref:hypothetical protein n=1 Tax=Serratia ureilytica TaxID=300181 RepID=UPI00313A847F
MQKLVRPNLLASAKMCLTSRLMWMVTLETESSWLSDSTRDAPSRHSGSIINSRRFAVVIINADS